MSSNESALESKTILETMAALGAHISAPRGSTIWLVRIPERENKGDRSTKPLGVYPSEEEAYKALANHAKQTWETSYYYSPHAPWYQYPTRANLNPDMRTARKEWILNKTDQEITQLYIELLSKNDDCTFPADITFYILQLKVKSN